MPGSPTINQIDSKYRVIAQLGQGGTADVSLAVARGLKGFTKLVVLKSMRAQFRAEPEFAEMFMVEARLAARLSHPNVVQTNEVFDFEGLPVIVMEYLEGQPLSAVVGKAKGSPAFPLAMHLRVLSEILAGLHYSHEIADYDGSPLGVVHRDMSPQNVFITYDGQVKVLDFGIAKINSSQEPATGVLRGKLAYMPAEQLMGENVDRRCDVYAVGVMLWEAVVGRRMWAGASESAIMNAVLNGEVPSPSSVGAEVDPKLERIILQALACEPADRYPTAAALQADLEEYNAEQGSNLRVRDIGAAVSYLFADVRAEQQKTIQEQLAKVASLSATDLQGFQPIELTTFEATGSATQGEPVAPVRRKWPWLAFAALVALSFVGFFSLRRPPAPPAAQPAPVAASSDVQVRISASPAEAQLSIDGVPMPNPVSRAYRRNPGRTVEVAASAPGHRSESRRVELSESVELMLDLSPLPTPTPVPSATAPPGTGQPKVPARPKPKPTATPSADCKPPYYIDERGVKKFKRACL